MSENRSVTRIGEKCTSVPAEYCVTNLSPTFNSDRLFTGVPCGEVTALASTMVESFVGLTASIASFNKERVPPFPPFLSIGFGFRGQMSEKP